MERGLRQLRWQKLNFRKTEQVSVVRALASIKPPTLPGRVVAMHKKKKDAIKLLSRSTPV